MVNGLNVMFIFKFGDGLEILEFLEEFQICYIYDQLGFYVVFMEVINFIMGLIIVLEVGMLKFKD